MKVRLRDWASLNCISERTVQIHIKENQDVLEEHIERKGKQGTWLDEFAQDFLIEKIQLPNRVPMICPSTCVTVNLFIFCLQERVDVIMIFPTERLPRYREPSHRL